MIAPEAVARYWHTLRRLKPVQWYGRAWFRLHRPRPDLGVAPPLRQRCGTWVTPIEKARSQLDLARRLFLADDFPLEVNAPASRTHEHCREWVRAGHEVTVVTAAPNFPHGWVFAGYHNRWWRQERIDGIRVIRVWTYIVANEGFARRVLLANLADNLSRPLWRKL